jgi:putative cell wall-binding protein
MAGPDRYATAAAVVGDAFAPGVEVAYVATGAAFPDALASAAVAGMTRAPVLLVTKTGIPAPTAAQLARLKPARIIVVGGPGAVSDGVLASLDALATGGATRIAGPDRYGTAAALSRATFPDGAAVVYLTVGTDFADAVSAAPAAARDHGPVLLVGRDTIPAASLAELVRLDPARVVVVGGTAAVSTATTAVARAAVPGATFTRLAGSDRYGTSAAVAATFGPNVSVVYAASGLSFADALAGAAAAGSQGAPMVITAPSSLPSPIRDQIVRLDPGRAVIVGGAAAVAETVVTAIRGAVATP